MVTNNPDNRTNFIEVINLTKYYGTKCAIDNINFNLNSGEIIGLLGLNGSGKTTTIRILSNFLIPTSGNVLLNGIDTFRNPMEFKNKIGYLPEIPPLYEDFDVVDYLKFVSRLKNVPESKIENEIERVCKRTNILEVKNKIISHLSLGFKKRVGIAMAIIGNPFLIIMDEPISGLDPKQIIEIRNLIKELSKEHSILISSHILSEMVKTCNRFLFLLDGKLVKQLNHSELELEMQKHSKLEISLSGKSQYECAEYLSNLQVNTLVNFIHEDFDGFIFQVTPSNEKIYKDELISSLSKCSLHLVSLKRIEITLEQIFMSIVN